MFGKKVTKSKKYTPWRLSKKHTELSVLTLGREIDWLFLLICFVIMFVILGLNAYGTYITITSESETAQNIVARRQLVVDEEKIAEIRSRYEERAIIFSERSGGAELIPSDVVETEVDADVEADQNASAEVDTEVGTEADTDVDQITPPEVEN